MLPELPPAYPDPLVLPGFLVPNNFTWPSLTAIKFLSWQASIDFLVLPGACPNLGKSLGFGLMPSDNTRLKTFYFRSVLTACFFFFFLPKTIPRGKEVWAGHSRTKWESVYSTLFFGSPIIEITVNSVFWNRKNHRFVVQWYLICHF